MNKQRIVLCWGVIVENERGLNVNEGKSPFQMGSLRETIRRNGKRKRTERIHDGCWRGVNLAFPLLSTKSVLPSHFPVVCWSYGRLGLFWGFLALLFKAKHQLCTWIQANFSDVKKNALATHHQIDSALFFSVFVLFFFGCFLSKLVNDVVKRVRGEQTKLAI